MDMDEVEGRRIHHIESFVARFFSYCMPYGASNQIYTFIQRLNAELTQSETAAKISLAI
jgi:hypothetical protein